MKQWLWLLVATVASAFLFQAALPPVGWSVLGWFCFTPTLLACRGRGFAVGFASGLFAVMGAGFLARYGLWCTPSLLDGDPGWIYAGFALFGGPVGLLHGLVGEARESKWWTPLLFAAWAVLFEALLLLYLPANIALTQSRNMLLLDLASVTGIWGVSYLVWAANLAFAESLHRKDRRAFTSVAVGVVFLCLGRLVDHQHAGSRGFHLTAVQAPLEDGDYLLDSTKNGHALSGIVVWPEGSGMTFVTHGDTSKLTEWAKTPETYSFTTTFDDDLEPHPHNTMAVFTNAGESPRYFKRKLFGGERFEHTAGTTSVATSVGGQGLGLNVCFDSCYPSVMRETALLPDVRIILLPTLDPASPYGVCQAIHAAYTPFRAAELGVFIVRAEATAYSMVVDNHGFVLSEAKSGTREVVTRITAPYSRNTFYKATGDWFLYACGLACLVPLVAKLKARVSKARRPD